MPEGPESIFVRHEGCFTKLIFANILFLEAEQNYVKVHFATSDMSLLISLRQLEQELPGYFCRVHRSFIVNTSQIERFDNLMVWFGKKFAPISRHYRDELSKKVNIILSETRSMSGISKLEMKNLLN